MVWRACAKLTRCAEPGPGEMGSSKISHLCKNMVARERAIVCQSRPGGYRLHRVAAHVQQGVISNVDERTHIAIQLRIRKHFSETRQRLWPSHICFGKSIPKTNLTVREKSSRILLEHECYHSFRKHYIFNSKTILCVTVTVIFGKYFRRPFFM